MRNEVIFTNDNFTFYLSDIKIVKSQYIGEEYSFSDVETTYLVYLDISRYVSIKLKYHDNCTWRHKQKYVLLCSFDFNIPFDIHDIYHRYDVINLVPAPNENLFMFMGDSILKSGVLHHRQYLLDSCYKYRYDDKAIQRLYDERRLKLNIAPVTGKKYKQICYKKCKNIISMQDDKVLTDDLIILSLLCVRAIKYIHRNYDLDYLPKYIYHCNNVPSFKTRLYKVYALYVSAKNNVDTLDNDIQLSAKELAEAKRVFKDDFIGFNNMKFKDLFTDRIKNYILERVESLANSYVKFTDEYIYQSPIIDNTSRSIFAHCKRK